MGRHSIRGVTTGEELNVVGTYSRKRKKHHIEGGEYTTIDGITYSIAPQGPNRPLYCDVRCNTGYNYHGKYQSNGQWYKPWAPEIEGNPSLADLFDVLATVPAHDGRYRV